MQTLAWIGTLGQKQTFVIFSVVSFQEVSNCTQYDKNNPNQFFFSFKSTVQWNMHVSLVIMLGL